MIIFDRKFIVSHQNKRGLNMEQIDDLNIKDEEVSKRRQFFQGVRDCIPTILGYLSIGLACGILCRSCNLTFWQAVGMSTFVYAGSSQFIGAGMIASGASPLGIIFTIFFVNLRHIFMSASMAPYFKHNTFVKNLSIGALLTDETFLVASNKGMTDKKIDFWWMTGLNITAYINWIIATGAGVLIGNLIPDYKKYGLDFALTAMFIGLLISSIENVKIKKACIIISVSIIVLIISTSFVDTSVGVIIASIAGALSGVMVGEKI